MRCVGWLHRFCSHSNSKMLIHPTQGTDLPTNTSRPQPPLPLPRRRSASPLPLLPAATSLYSTARSLRSRFRVATRPHRCPCPSCCCQPHLYTQPPAASVPAPAPPARPHRCCPCLLPGSHISRTKQMGFDDKDFAGKPLEDLYLFPIEIPTAAVG